MHYCAAGVCIDFILDFVSRLTLDVAMCVCCFLRFSDSKLELFSYEKIWSDYDMMLFLAQKDRVMIINTFEL